MKIALIAILAIAVANANLINVATQVAKSYDDVTFVRGMFYHMWNGFVKGLYSSQKANIVSEECFGAWVDTDFENLSNVAETLFEKFEGITYDEAITAGNNVVDIVYKNLDFCQFSKVSNDLNAICDFENPDECMPEDIFKNIMDNGFSLLNQA